MLTVGQAAKNIVNNPRCSLSLELQEKLVEIHDEEQVKLWADCNRACERGLNILTQAELDRE